MRTPADLPNRMPRTSRRFRLGVLIAVVVLILLLTTVRGAARFYVSFLWFQQVHFTSVFRGVLLTKLLLAVTFCVIFFALLFASLTITDRLAPEVLGDDVNDELVMRYREVVMPAGRWVRVITAAIFALFAGIGTSSEWDNFDLFRYHVPFGIQDPEYHRDIGFYVFQLPFIKFLLSWSFGAFVVVLLVTCAFAYLNGSIRVQGAHPRVDISAKVHVSALLGILAIIQGIRYYFARLSLVLSTAHVVDGATATSVNANRPAYELLMGIAVVAAVLFLLNTRVRGWTLPVVGVAVWAIVWILVGNIYPALYQALRVNPSELAREAPYIQRNITATRAAYGLDNINVQTNFDSTSASQIQPSEINGSSPQAVANRETLSNVQLLDPNQLQPTFDKIQSLRSFYSIDNLSVDRYQLDGPNSPMTETLIGVRQLNGEVPSGFTQAHLEYTHGYGAVVAPANQSGVASNGKPVFSLSDIPPGGTPTLSDQGAQVYYDDAASPNSFVIADSKVPELDYENSLNNEVTSRYDGKGGVPAGGFFRRLGFALAFGDANFVLSGQVTSSSRVIFERNIMTEVQKAAPFLKYDADPYAVVLNNSIYWVVDAYTTTDNYPYSQQANTSRVSGSSGLSGSFNYVRNSVKVVINAYTGKMNFFVVDPSDPIIRVYERAFPDLFTNASQANKLIPGITDHWRYPEDLFKVQTNMYGRYHLTNVSAFFSQANAWNISEDPGSGRPDTTSQVATTNANGTISFSPALLNPSYEVAALPGQTEQQFLIQQAFVPVSAQSSRQNLTAVLYGSSDPGSYGQLTLYETPPGETVDGPDLVSSFIKSNPSISQELTLLNQQGSEVELGQVVSVPIGETLLYVLPVYVQATGNAVPSLVDVVVGYNGAAYHSSNASLDNALCQLQNSDGTRPFASYCNTSAANRKTLTLPSGSTKPKSSSPTSTTTTTTTPAPPPSSPTSPVTAPAGQSLSQLLADAQAAYRSAEAALRAGNLAAYQRYNSQAAADVAQAAREASSSSTRSTTKKR